MAKKHTRTIYKDKKTGKPVSKATWKRSKAQGGTRYTRKRVKVKASKPKPKEPKELPVYEWILAGEREREEDYGTTPAGTSHFNVIVTARTREEAIDTASLFLEDELPKIGDEVQWKRAVKVPRETSQSYGLAEWR